MTDMTHDDGNSLIRYLHYAHLFDTEAIIVTNQLPDYYHDSPEPWNKAQEIIKAYQRNTNSLANIMWGTHPMNNYSKLLNPAEVRCP